MPVIKCFNGACPHWEIDEPDHCSHPIVEILKCEHSRVGKGVKKDYGNSYLSALMSNECHCGKGKKPRRSLCYSCYRSLPRDFQHALWSRFGHGYEEAYEAAVEWLDEHQEEGHGQGA